MKKAKPCYEGLAFLEDKWYHQESNRGHKDFQSFALPTELWHQLYETNEDCSFASAKVAFLFRSTKFFLTFLSKKFKKAANILFYIVFSVTLQAILRGMRQGLPQEYPPRDLAQLVAHVVRDDEVAGSSPVIPTIHQR